MSQSASGPCAVTWMDEQRTNAQRRHCFLPGFFCLFVCLTFLHLISVSFCGLALLHLKKKNTQKKKSRWYVLHSVGTVDVNVCTLYSTFINTCRVLSLGENIEVYEIVPLFFYVKKTIKREKIFKNEWKKITL